MGRKKKIFIHLFIFILFFYFFLYGGTSGLHAHTHGHARLGVVCCCWHVAVGCCTLLWYPVCLLVLANHRRRVAGCLANKLHCLLYSFSFFTNWWSQRHIWWNVLDKSLVTGVLEFFPWLCRPSQDLSNLKSFFVTYKSTCIMGKSVSAENVSELECYHEEADKHLIVHAALTAQRWCERMYSAFQKNWPWDV